MKTLKQRFLLRRRNPQSFILKEDDGGGYGDIMGAAAGMSPFGMSFGSQEDFYNIFVKPFTDVWDIGKAGVKKISASTQALLRVAFEAISTSLLPWLADDYKDIFQDEEKAMAEIKNEYSDVYRDVYAAYSNEDFLTCAFMYSPQAFITAKAVKKAPGAVANMLDILSGGTLKRVTDKVRETYGDFFEDHEKSSPYAGPKPYKNKKKGSAKTTAHGSAWMTGEAPEGMWGGGMGEGVIHEEKEEEEKKARPSLEKVLTDPKILDVVSKSLKTKKMEELGHKIVDGMLAKVLQRAQAVTSVKSLKELETKFGKKLTDQKSLKQLEELPESERQQAELALLKNFRAQAINFYVQALQQQLSKALKAGTPSESPFVSAYKTVISKIKALA
jgi:hypothetical protein